MQTSEIQANVIDLIQGLIADFGYNSDEDIGADTALIRDIGFASLDFVQLIVGIESLFQQKLGFQDLLVENGQYVEDVTVRELVSFIDRQLQNSISDLPLSAMASTVQKVTPVVSSSFEIVNRVDLATIERFHLSIRPRSPRPVGDVSAKNPRAIFVLSPPRSGSTLLRVILAGHPQLFSPPELYLLMYNDLAQRRRELVGEVNSHLLEGAIRAIMQSRGCDADEADSLMASYEAEELSTKEFYARLQSWIGDRILVDKTPLYPLDLDILKRAEEDFIEPLYIHLTRHPYGMIRSYEESKLDRFVPVLYENSFQPRELAELTWLVSNQNIMSFLETVPKERWIQLKFEDLVTQPDVKIPQLCDFLQLPFAAGMLEPYGDRQQRMLEGSRQLTRMPGDLKFHLHKDIDAATANLWRKSFTHDFLSDISWQIAANLGYSPEEIPQINQN